MEHRQPKMTVCSSGKPQVQQEMANMAVPSLPLISEISLVEEPFVSPGSEELQALNFIA
jgi:hypothetical protein